ncbi:Txe/YoeB family addiction module toxin [Caproiciproducens galactitolivorans]|uniref:Endoribonuclease YoeB n=1 Tax=Caproiciproducens galactitolivorans TaxID=642589 RepID=A0ABT4BXJ1_9FIRM|nr:Txe/YoeB family addiction module toxin [Caproiciproducens galactitolivorans]MCY1714656.1 Txe/YoeB family addiction module toxin [Caproiciproducens galactitolivorans]
MNSLIFLPEAWDDYIYWQENDKKTLRRINLLLQDISRSAFVGIGKPEPLQGNLSGWWSRRIDDTNRIVYRVQGDGKIEIAQCKGHYSGH